MWDSYRSSHTSACICNLLFNYSLFHYIFFTLIPISTFKIPIFSSTAVDFYKNVFPLVLRPNITDITFTPQPTNTSLLLNFTNSQLMTCSASGGPRIMTMWLFDDGSSLSTVANGSDTVTHNISSSSTSDTGSYYCIVSIDGMNDTSDVYTLFGESCTSNLLFSSCNPYS